MLKHFSFFFLILWSVLIGRTALAEEALPTTEEARAKPEASVEKLGTVAKKLNAKQPGVGPLLLLVLAAGLCCVWFGLVAGANGRRADNESRRARVADTLNFLSFGLLAIPGLALGRKGFRLFRWGLRGGKGRLARMDTSTVLFLGPDGQPREPGAGPATSAAKELVAGAVEKGATDIHLEPKGEELQVRYRVDGELHNVHAYGRDLGPQILACLKVAAEMDIAERRRPQDGSFAASMGGTKMVDFRVSTAPSAFGEKMVIRVLDKSRGLKRLEDLGFRAEVLQQIRTVIHAPHGMLICCGPTGSGKTTTLYAALSELDASRKNIITIENPIEYHLPNVTQTPINEKAGITFAGVLRSSLRQDPDVLMVGEIRDAETAQVAMQAAMTGHFVFTTLHANDSVGSVFRLLDLELEPFMVSSALSAVLSQRLVKLLCPSCKQPYPPKPEFVALARQRGMEIREFYKPVGCEKCLGHGYKGRLGVHELMVINDALRHLIQQRPSITEIQEAARKSGIKLLREDALQKAAQGLTSVEEVLSLLTA